MAYVCKQLTDAYLEGFKKVECCFYCSAVAERYFSGNGQHTASVINCKRTFVFFWTSGEIVNALRFSDNCLNCGTNSNSNTKLLTFSMSVIVILFSSLCTFLGHNAQILHMHHMFNFHIHCFVSCLT